MSGTEFIDLQEAFIYVFGPALQYALGFFLAGGIFAALGIVFIGLMTRKSSFDYYPSNINRNNDTENACHVLCNFIHCHSNKKY